MDELRKHFNSLRKSIPKEERELKSRAACELLMSTEEYKNARTIMIYRAMKGELDLSLLESCARAEGKTLLYPLCTGPGIMKALEPESPDAFRKGSFGIGEPDPERSKEADPASIDLVVCPCSAFNGEIYRLGMGGGYYDRFLPLCKNAKKIVIAFEVQRSNDFPVNSWDVPAELAVTEAGIYRRQDLAQN